MDETATVYRQSAESFIPATNPAGEKVRQFIAVKQALDEYKEKVKSVINYSLGHAECGYNCGVCDLLEEIEEIK